MRNRTAPTSDRFARSEQFEVFTRPQRSRPARLLGLVIRLRAEITAAVVLLLAWRWLGEYLGSWDGDRPPPQPDEPPPTWLAEHWTVVVAGVVFVVLAAVLTVIPHTRRYLSRRAVAVLTRHRLRAVFIERRVMNWSGNLPGLLWSRPTPVGERVWVLLRAGINGGDIERNLDHVASGCLARDARISVARSMTALVRVDVVRRDPLTAPVPAPRRSSDNDAASAVRPPLHVVPDEKGA